MTDLQRCCRKRYRRKSVVSDGGRPPLDRVLQALSRERDRCILYCLTENEAVDIDELVDAVIELERDEPPATVPDGERRKVRTKLHHARLPKLEALGIVEYDKRNGAIRYRNPPPHFEDFLHLARELEED